MAPDSSRSDLPYVDLVLQLQTHGSAALAQVLALDQRLLEHLRDPRFRDRIPAVLAQRARRLVLLPDFAELWREGGSLTRVIPCLLAAEKSQADTGGGSGLHESHEIGQWIRLACDWARGKDMGVRLRLQVSTGDQPQLLTWAELRARGMLGALADGSDELSEGELDDRADWVPYVPWEVLVYALGPEFYPPISLVRSLPLIQAVAAGTPAQVPSTRQATGMLRIFLAWASPSDLLPIADPERMTSRIREGLAANPAFYVPEPSAKLTLADLERNLVDEWDVVHILAHGAPDFFGAGSDARRFQVAEGGLFFETSTGAGQRVSAHELARLLTACGKCPPQMVFLHACDSAAVFGDLFRGVAQSLIEAGVHYVVAMQAPVPADVAEAFALTFYRALSDWPSVDKAMSAARTAIAGIHSGADLRNNRILCELAGGAHLPASCIPVLYMSDAADGWLAQGPPPKAIRTLDGKVMLQVAAKDAMPFFIDKYPVTVSQFRAFQPDWTSPFDLNSRDSGRLPATYISVDEALGYAKRYGKALPSQDQWLAALDRLGRPPLSQDGYFDRRHCNLPGSGEPRELRAVDYYQTASNCHQIQDMIGNCAEIVLDETRPAVSLGGHFRYTFDLNLVTQPSTLRIPYNVIGFRCVLDLAGYHALLRTAQVGSAEVDDMDAQSRPLTTEVQ